MTLRDRRSSALVQHVSALRAAFHETHQAHPFNTVAVVILPDHLHWLCTLPEGDADFSSRIRLIKHGFTQRLLDAGIALARDPRGEYKLWQRRFWEHTIRDDADLQRHVDYIHYNPVKHGLVGAVKDWQHSSFHRHVRQGLLTEDWGGTANAETTGQYGEPTP